MTRRSVFRISTILLLSLFAPVAAHAGPASWGLEQNVPDPFCPDSTTTLITYALDIDCRAIIEVHLFDSADIVRTLVDEQLPAGQHSVLWDGRNDQGEMLPDGQYDIGMMVEYGGHYYLLPKRVATIECPLTPARDTRWGTIRLIYR